MTNLAMPGRAGYNHVFFLLKSKQDGLCHHCRKDIFGNEPIVTKASWVTKYYHKHCARYLNIF